LKRIAQHVIAHAVAEKVDALPAAFIALKRIHVVIEPPDRARDGGPGGSRRGAVMGVIAVRKRYADWRSNGWPRERKHVRVNAIEDKNPARPLDRVCKAVA